MELLHGSLADMSGRSDREIRTYEFLDRLGIEPAIVHLVGTE